MLLVVIAAICGGIGKAIAGGTRGSLITSIALGFFGALLGAWMARQLRLPEPFLLRVCTFGDPALPAGYGLSGFAGPYWGNLIVGIPYLTAALFVGFTKRRS